MAWCNDFEWFGRSVLLKRCIDCLAWLKWRFNQCFSCFVPLKKGRLADHIHTIDPPESVCHNGNQLPLFVVERCLPMYKLGLNDLGK